MEVIVVTGEKDPTPVSKTPQPPLHTGLFPLASQLTNFHLLTNPCQVTMPFIRSELSKQSNNLKIVVTSGSCVDDVGLTMENKCPVDVCRRLLQCGHLYPNSRHGCSETEDIFVLKNSLPHFFIVGNQEEFHTGSFNGTRIVCVPKFCESQTAVVFTKHHDIIPLKLKISF